jgi:endonuclease/exonuclease/phosphatase family metal-dependent hydrolase
VHYGNLKPYVAEGLIQLRKRIDKAKIPSSKLDESLNVATWNIREFGRTPRLEASIVYIAEIINQFDLVALVELRDNLGDLRRVMKVLGRSWDVVFSDFIEDDGGNQERIAFLYDKRMVRFTGLAAEADAPRVPESQEGRSRIWNTRDGWWRAPYMASFEAGSFDFVVIAAHIRWGSGVRDRTPALRALGEWVGRRAKHPFATDSDFILIGDFNIPSRRSSAYKALIGTDTGLQLPTKLANVKGTNLSQKNTYDQILHNATGEGQKRFTNSGGVLDFYEGDWKSLYPNASHRPRNRDRFTYELSDHLPLWIQIDTEIVDEHLRSLAGR